jgi:class 3 adenylate cyclase
VPLGVAVALGLSHPDRSLRRVLIAQSVAHAATVVAMVEAWHALQRGENPVPVALFWTGLGLLLAIPLAGPDKGMFKPVGAIQLPIPLVLGGADRLRVLVALGVLAACWSGLGLPWMEFGLVGLALGYRSWSRVRRQRIEHLLTGQTHQLRKDKEKVEELNQVLAESFSKFVPRDLVDELVAEGQLVRLRGEEREVTILFSDIRGYSTIIETLPPIRVLKVLNLYFNSMEKVIDRHGGTILEYVGDAILAVFGAPGDLPDHAEAATMCAVEMREALAEFNAEMEKEGLSDTWRAQGYDQLGARIGVHKGHVVAGTLGGTNQVRYSVLGDTVNVAARLEAYNKELGTEILISDAVFDSLGDRFELPATDHGPILLKGRSSAQRCYSL